MLTGFLVIGRCGMDDIPIRMYEEKRIALRRANCLTTRYIAKYARRVMGGDVSIFCCSAIVPFINGVPQPVEIVREY